MEGDPAYVSGFVDGEGSFLVSFQMREKLRIGVEARPSFTVSQNMRNQDILIWLQQFFNCGSIRFNRRDRTYKYEVRSLEDLIHKIIPHFERHPLRTCKKTDFNKFKQICRLISKKKHLMADGIGKIIQVAYSMNNLGSRKYDQGKLLRIVNKMKV